MSDIEQLIIAVEGYPCLWDCNHKDYHNRDLKDLAWQAVTREIYSDWESFDEIKRRDACNIIKKKWSYIRDYYRRDQQRMNNTPSGSGARQDKKPYTYAPFLEFLKPTFMRRKSEGNYNDNDANTQNELDDMEPGDNMELASSSRSQEMEYSLLQNDNAFMEAAVTTTCRANTTKGTTRKKKDVPEKTLSLIEQQVSQPPSTEDDDTKFFLSLRGEIKRRSHSQKLDFKIEMLQLVKRIRNHNESLYSRPSTAFNDTNVFSYISSPSPSPNKSAHAPTSSAIQRKIHSESPYTCPSTGLINESNPATCISRPSPSHSRSADAPMLSINRTKNHSKSPSTLSNKSNPITYASSPSHSPNNSAHAPKLSKIRKINQIKPNKHPSTAFNETNPATYIPTPPPSLNSSAHAPSSSLTPLSTGFAPTLPRFTQSQNIATIEEPHSVTENEDYTFNSQPIMNNSQFSYDEEDSQNYEPIETYLSFK